jgi:hypothetical protein
MLGKLVLAPVALAADATLAAVDGYLAVVCLPIEHGPIARLLDRGWARLGMRILPPVSTSQEDERELARKLAA